MKQMLRIGRVTSENTGEMWTVSASVDGERLWFRSEDCRLIPSPEGIVSAVLFPALQARRPIQIDAPLDPVWLDNIQELMAIYHEWWGLSPVPIEGVGSCRPDSQEGLTRRALCFSGGVDSFYSLITHVDNLTDIVYIGGYDVPLNDTCRLEIINLQLTQISKETGLHRVMISTNLRDHAIYKGINWERSHGGGLAAIGHLLSGTHSLGISSSIPYGYNLYWGSHFKTDKLFSSTTMTVDHLGADQWRTDKLIMIKDHPLVQQNLRVCWQNRSNDLNCGSCEKCIRTMLILEQVGVLKDYTTFPAADNLSERIRKLIVLPPRCWPIYERFSQQKELAHLQSELRALLRRSRRLRPFVATFEGIVKLARIILPKTIFICITKVVSNG